MGAVLLLSFPCLFTTEEAILATGSAVQVSSMGNDLSAIGGAVATVGTSIAAGVTLGQVKELNQAVVSTYQFTANKVSGSIIGNGVAAAASGIATAGTGLAAGVTLGQVDALNKATEHLARGTVHHVSFAGEETGKAAIGLMDGTPVVGHLKGLGDAYPCNGADQRFNTALQDINSFIRPLGTKRRVKRQVCQTGTDILTAKYKFQERAAWKVMNKRLGPLDDIVDSHMKLADLMQDSGKWRKRMNKMLPDEIDNVVMNLKKSAANARAVSAIHGPETGHAYRYNTYDIAVSNLERFQAQRAMAVPPAPPRVRPTGPTRTWGPPL